MGGKGRAKSTAEQISARVPNGTTARLDALIPYVSKLPDVGVVAGMIARAHVLRVAVERGLLVLERDALSGVARDINSSEAL